MFDRSCPHRRLFVPVLFLLALFAGGCGGARHPVSGRVLLDGKPLEGKEGYVVLKPDATRGNHGRVAPISALKSDGTYSVFTKSLTGAASGWYKVLVNASEPGANPNEDAAPVLNPRYLSEGTTPLAVEVVAQPEPGSYDLQLSSE